MLGLFTWRKRRVRTNPKYRKSGSRSKYLANKEVARKLVTDKLDVYIERYKSIGISLSYNKLSIRDQSTRWGSCSAKGNLNFNYKIIYLGENLVEYIVAHELCHLVEMNHGKNFWRLVSLTMPDYAICRTELNAVRLSNL